MKKPTKYYAIVCHPPFGEIQTVRVLATTPKRAVTEAKATLRRAHPKEYRKVVKEYGYGIYIDAVLESDTEIREVIP